MTIKPFDKAATKYDETFTHTFIGKAQRKTVWFHIDKNYFPKNSNLLELNCGTGEDAHLWHERKINVLSTDNSNQMIRVSISKFPNICFKQLDIKYCKNDLVDKDIVFSNFGGFNCLNQNEIRNFFLDANKNLAVNSSVILVIMGKKCIWDNLFLLAKGKFRKIGRRNTNQALLVSVEHEIIKTWYYTPNEIKKMAGSNFKVERLKPIGLFVPPSYLSNWFMNKLWLLSILELCDRILPFGFFANYADHYYIQFTKRK
jgi:hypothetical protein